MGFTLAEDYLRLYSYIMFREIFFFLLRLKTGSVSQDFKDRHSSSSAFSVKGRTRKKIANFLPTCSRHAVDSKSRKTKGTGKVTRDRLPFSRRIITPRRQCRCNYRLTYHAVASHIKCYWHQMSSRERYPRVFGSRMRFRLDIAIRYDSALKH